MPQKNDAVSGGDDFEVVAMSPIRRLEKRLDAIETTKTSQNLEHFIDKVIDMVELNQRIVDEVVKANQGLREDIAVLIGKMTDNETKHSELLHLLKEAGDADVGGDYQNLEKAIAPIFERVSETTAKTLEANASILDALASIDRNIKKLAPQAPTSITSSILARRALQTKPA